MAAWHDAVPIFNCSASDTQRLLICDLAMSRRSVAMYIDLLAIAGMDRASISISCCHALISSRFVLNLYCVFSLLALVTQGQYESGMTILSLLFSLC